MLIVKDKVYSNFRNNIINKGDILNINEYKYGFNIVTKSGFCITINYTDILTYEEIRSIIVYIDNLCETNYNITKNELEDEVLQHLKDLKDLKDLKGI